MHLQLTNKFSHCGLLLTGTNITFLHKKTIAGLQTQHLMQFLHILQGQSDVQFFTNTM